MAISLRIPKRLEQALDRAARQAGVSKSEYLRQCLEQRLAADVSRPSAYELGKDLFGGDPSGRTDLATNAKQIFRELIHAKTRRS